MWNEASIMYLFYLLLVAFIYLLFFQVASRQVDVPTEFIRSILRSNDVVKIMLQHIYPLFCFDSGIQVASMSSVDSIPFLNRCSHISMGVLILLDHRDLHVNPFQLMCLLFKLFHTDAVEKSDDLSVSFIPSRLCFSPPSLPFLYGAGILK